MSNFKEIYPQRNFREDLYRMDSLGKDDYEVLAYNGIPDEAPLASNYCYTLENHFKTARGKSLSIRDAINAPVKRVAIYGHAEYALPDEYTKLYYLESTGTQYIDTGIMGVGSVEAHARFAFTTTPSSYYMLAGVRNGGNNRCYIFNVNDAGHWGLGYISTLAELTTEKPIINKIYNGYCKLSAGAQEIILNNDRYIKNYGGTLNINYSIYIFGLHYINGGQVNCSARLYSFDLSVDGVLKRNFIPVKRNSDGELGLYDLVTNTFFANQGTGDFITGPEMGGGTINNPVEIESIGTFQEETGQWETLITCNDIKTKLVHEQPLCNIGEEYVDYYDDGVIYYNTIYTQLLSSSNWQIDNTLTTDSVLVVSLFIPSAINQTDYVYCTHFSPSSDMTVPNHIKIDNQRIYLSLDRTDIGNLNQFVDWLKNNRVIVIYNRKRSKKVVVEPKLILKTYDDTTNITNDQNAEMEIEYRVAPNARVWKKQEDGTFIELTS